MLLGPSPCERQYPRNPRCLGCKEEQHESQQRRNIGNAVCILLPTAVLLWTLDVPGRVLSVENSVSVQQLRCSSVYTQP